MSLYVDMDYITPEAALELKKAGFSHKCRYYLKERHDGSGWEYKSGESKENYNDTKRFGKQMVSLPTLYNVQKWLRKTKMLSVEPFSDPVKGWNYRIRRLDDSKEEVALGFLYDTYEEALNEGCLEAIKTLTP